MIIPEVGIHKKKKIKTRSKQDLAVDLNVCRPANNNEQRHWTMSVEHCNVSVCQMTLSSECLQTSSAFWKPRRKGMMGNIWSRPWESESWNFRSRWADDKIIILKRKGCLAACLGHTMKVRKWSAAAAAAFWHDDDDDDDGGDVFYWSNKCLFIKCWFH